MSTLLTTRSTRWRRSSEALCKFQIQRRGTMLAVDDEEEQIGAFDGDLRGGVRLLGKVWIRARANAARVDYLEGGAASRQTATIRSRVTPG